MRLSPAELSAIRGTLGALDPLGRVYLFGSRADDLRRGGDIDIFLEASRDIDLRTTLTTEYRLHSACDCKVDLLIKTPSQPDQPIHQIARKGIPL
jgi:predicted nucleotidyltransferase